MSRINFKSIQVNTLQFLLLLILFNTQVVAQSIRDEYIDVGGYILHLKIMSEEFSNSTSPTIVLESGGGGDSTQWSSLQPQLVNELNKVVVSYNRFGFGESDLPQTPYDIREEVAALHTALEVLGLSNSVLLVGHSLSGLHIQSYATQWPDQVKGLLFIDPNTPGAMIGLSDLLFSQPVNPNPETKSEKAFARINEALLETMTVIFQAPLPQNVPIIVISAEQGLFPLERYNKAFKITHQLLAASVENGKYIIAEGSGHNIPGERPDLVISSLKMLLDE